MRPEAQPLLSLRALTVRYPGAAPVLHGVDLDVQPGECLGVVGPSGAGKSQLFLAALGLLPPQAEVSGSARYAGTELLGLPRRALDRLRGGKIGLVFQDARAALTPHATIGAQLAEVRRRHCGESRALARRHARDLLERVQVSDAARRLQQYPHELSGGLCQRAMIALALAAEPRLLIADEPTTALDLTVQSQILALLAALKEGGGLSLVLITHDLGSLAGIADRVAELEAGRQVRSGAWRPGPAGTPAAAESPPAAGAALLALQGVSVRHRLPGWRGPTLEAVHGLDLTLAAGVSLGIVGESGSGKSTLLRVALALQPPSEGRVRWDGTDLASLGAAALRGQRRNRQLIFQDPAGSLDPRLTVAEAVGEGLAVHAPQLAAAERSAAVCAVLQAVGLGPELLARHPHELSGGQCQRVAIARALVLNPRVLCCDEPMSALDATSQAQVSALLARSQREAPLTLLFVSHDLAAVRALCHEVFVLYLGRRMERGPVTLLHGAARHPYTQELLRAEPAADPAVERARLAAVRPGEMPSALAPPSGCVFRTRCPYALARCAAQVPPWESVAPGHEIACHRWRELPPGG